MTVRTDASTTRDGLRVGAVALFAVLQVLSAPLTPVLLGDDANTGTVSDENRSLLTPAGYAFSIWGLIYLASLAYAVYQALPSQRHRDVHRRTGWLVAAAFACSTVWVPLFGVDALVIAQVVIVALVVLLALALMRYAGTDATNGWRDRLLVATPISLYLGWASIASVAGFATTGVSLDAPTDAGWAPALAVAVLVVVAAVAVGAIASVPAVLGFMFSSAWGFAAIGAGTDDSTVSLAAYVAAAVVVGAALVKVTRSHRPARAALG